MSIVYELKVTKLQIYPIFAGYSNVVSKVYATLAGTNDNNITRYELLGVNLNPPSQNFISFESLTEDQVIEWIQPALNAVESRMKESIEMQLNGATETLIEYSNLPWSNN